VINREENNCKAEGQSVRCRRQTTALHCKSDHHPFVLVLRVRNSRRVMPVILGKFRQEADNTIIVVNKPVNYSGRDRGASLFRYGAPPIHHKYPRAMYHSSLKNHRVALRQRVLGHVRGWPPQRLSRRQQEAKRESILPKWAANV
jgi:hypothetical protein